MTREKGKIGLAFQADSPEGQKLSLQGALGGIVQIILSA